MDEWNQSAGNVHSRFVGNWPFWAGVFERSESKYKGRMLMATWESGDVQVNGLRLHYTRTGGAKPPVVLAHGFSDDSLCWTPVAEVLALDYDVIMVDARGHGQSDAPERGYNMADMAGDLRGVIAELGLHKPVVMGHSMGGGTTLALAGLYPDVPGAILLEDAAPLGLAAMRMPHDPDRHARIMESIVRSQSQSREQLIAEQRAATPMWSEVALELVVNARLRLSPKTVGFDPTVAVDWPVVLGRITCPALLISADPDRGGMISAESAAVFQSYVPQLRVITIAGAGHCVRYEQLGRYMDVVRGFLAGVTSVK
jgi:N-formylmaleamate deformylase